MARRRADDASRVRMGAMGRPRPYALGPWWRLAGRRACRGLTLIELVVVLALLGLIASAVFPSAAYVLNRAREQDAQAILSDSWKLARAMALASNEPVWWQVRQTQDGVEITIRPASETAARRTLVLRGWTAARPGAGASDSEAAGWRVLLAPHGLAEDVVLTLSRDGAPAIDITLPGVIDDSASVSHRRPR